MGVSEFGPDSIFEVRIFDLLFYFFSPIPNSSPISAVDILSDILLHSRLGEREIERERDVILREQKEVRTWKIVRAWLDCFLLLVTKCSGYKYNG